MVGEQYVTPESFGAKGDAAGYAMGTATDDTAALQAAYDSGKSVWLVSTYLTSGVTLTRSGVRIDGPGGLVKKRGVDGILVANSGSRNTIRGTYTGFNASFTGSIAGTTLTVSSALIGTIRPGAMLGGTGVDTRTFVVAQASGTTGGVGTYTVSVSQTVPVTQIVFTDAITFNLSNDLIRNNGGAQVTVERVTLAGSAGGGVANYGGAAFTLRSASIVGVHDNGWIVANAGADDLTVDDVLVDGTGTQNCGFLTASAGSSATADMVRRPKIGRLVHRNAGDTALEIGQHSADVIGGDWTLGPSANPPLLIRDAVGVKASKVTLIAPPLASQNPQWSHLAVVPYYESAAWVSRIELSDVEAVGQAARAVAYVGQSGIAINGTPLIDTGATAVNGSDLQGAFLVLGGSVADVRLSRVKARGFQTVAALNYAASPTPVARVVIEDCSFDAIGTYMLAYNVTLTQSRSVRNTIRSVLTTVYKTTASTLTALATVPGLIVDDAVTTAGFTGATPSLFEPGDMGVKGVATRAGTAELPLPMAVNDAVALGAMTALAGKMVRLVYTDGSADALFGTSPSAGMTYKLGGSAVITDASGASGDALFVSNGTLYLQRRGTARTTAGTFQWSAH